jgi:NCS2 family nucleobase:cation symporter-2/xanthine permease XanP
MTKHASAREAGLRYQADEKLPAALAIGLGLQLAVLIVAFPILIPTVVMRAAGTTDAYLSWAVFASVAVSGATTALQAVRYGRIGSGHVLMMSSSTAFIWPCIAAIERSGPGLLVTLVVISALLQFVLSARIVWFRRILTPTVSGTMLMLLPVSAMPAVFDLLTGVPEGSPGYASPVCAAVTVVVIAGIALKSTGSLRLWAPIIGVLCGSVVAGIIGIYDVDRVLAASWIGLPSVEWPGFDLEFGPAFWSLLPVFLLLTPIVTLRTISSCVAVQSISWRRRRAVDYRAVQGAVNVDGVSNLLCGLAGTVPNNSYTIGASLTEITGVAARSVGIVAGAIFLVLAFLPKALAVVLAMPDAVSGGFLIVLLAMLFLIGIKVLLQDGLDYRKSLIAGVAFWIGVGFQNDMIFPAQVSAFAGGLFANGVLSGGLAAILMTLFVQLTESRRSRMVAELDTAALSKIREFLRGFATRNGWDDAMADRLEAVGEEALLSLLRPEEDETLPDRRRRLRLVAARAEGGAVLEFVVAPTGENVEDRLAVLGDQADETAIEHDVSLRLLRHLASSVRHQQYHDLDVVTVRVKPPAAAAQA